jgi:ribosomal-protein-alanine N-acetyltransferase
LKENPRPVGTICCFDFSTDQATAEIGYELHPSYQHKGIMQEALTTVLRYGFQVLQLKSITAFPSADNVPSIRLLERNGFKREDDGQQREGNLVRFVLRGDLEILNV